MLNFVAFNFVWLGLVYWGNTFIPFATLFFCGHIVYIYNKQKNEILLIIIVALLGILVDTILQGQDVFLFAEKHHLPFWLITLWFCFATTLSHSLNFLSHSVVMQALVGALIAPLSYIAGNQCKVVVFGYSTLSTFFILSVIWCQLMVVFYFIKSYLIKEENTHV